LRRALVAIVSIGVFLALLLIGILHTPEEARPLRISLDFFPNPNHVPLYVAIEDGLFQDRGVDVEIIVPANPSDPAKLAAARTIDVALTPQINYLIARSEGLPLVSIGALIDRNLGGLLAVLNTGIASAEDLRGRRIGYSLAPLEPILWETMLRCVGVSIDEVELVNVGYATIPSLLTGSIDAVGAFRNFEPIQVELQGAEPIFFPQEEYCIPATYDIILVAHPSVIEKRESDLRALLDVLSEAIAYTRAHPETAFLRFVSANPDLDDALNRRSFDATLPLYAAGARHDDPEIWRAMQAYLLENELIATEFPLDALYTTALLPED
jgi:putative hydroxymethylpyrimidine transport system substrate-binding protein